MNGKRVARRRSRFWLILLCLMALPAYAAFRLFPNGAPRNGSARAASQPSRRVPVIVAAARRGDLPMYLDGLGTVTAFKTVTVRPRVEGQLIKVSIVEGQMIHEGDELAEIDPRPFQADLDSKTAAEAQASAQVDMARITYDRLKELMPEQSASPIEFQQAEAMLKQAVAALAGAKAAVETARLNVEWCRITAPIGGRIGLRLVDQGNMVHVGDSGGVAVIAQLEPIAVVFSLPQSTLPQVLKAGGGRSLVTEAFDSDLATKLATGVLLAVDNQIDPGTGTAKCKAVFENQDNALFPNQFVNIRLRVDTRKDAVLIPAAGVQRSPQTAFVYVVKDGDTVEMRPINSGPTEGGLTLIEQGLAPGEVVVTDGVDKLQPGMKVNIRQHSQLTTNHSQLP